MLRANTHNDTEERQMILYFSATGNCKYVAQRLAAARRTAHFRVEDSCIGCGLYARKSPVQAIRMENSRPVWVQEA